MLWHSLCLTGNILCWQLLWQHQLILNIFFISGNKRLWVSSFNCHHSDHFSSLLPHSNTRLLFFFLPWHCPRPRDLRLQTGYGDKGCPVRGEVAVRRTTHDVYEGCAAPLKINLSNSHQKRTKRSSGGSHMEKPTTSLLPLSKQKKKTPQ